MTGNRTAPVTLPTFLIVGAMKAGTTSLFTRLAAHRDIGMASIKEPDFFVAEKNLSRGLEWYSSLFSEVQHLPARGEASTTYSKCTEFPGVPARIQAMVPDVRLVYVLRDPVDRIRSMYQHNVLHGRERRPIDVAVLSDPMYVGASSYALQMQQFLAHFDRDQLHVLTVDDLKDRPEPTLRALCDHLEVGWDPAVLEYEPRANVTEGRRADTVASRLVKKAFATALGQARVPSALRGIGRSVLMRERRLDDRPSDAATTELITRLAPDLAELERLLGRNFDEWRAHVG